MPATALAERDTEELQDEYYSLRRQSANGELNADEATRRDALFAELARRAAIPPEGYTLPKTAADLVAAAEAAGWKTLVQWQASDDTPFVTVQIGRAVTPAESAQFEAQGFYGKCWKFDATWHGRNTKPGCLRLFGQVSAETPEHPASHGSSVKQALAAIAAHPLTPSRSD